jgi:hypothetical protein
MISSRSMPFGILFAIVLHILGHGLFVESRVVQNLLRS